MLAQYNLMKFLVLQIKAKIFIQTSNLEQMQKKFQRAENLYKHAECRLVFVSLLVSTYFL